MYKNIDITRNIRQWNEVYILTLPHTNSSTRSFNNITVLLLLQPLECFVSLRKFRYLIDII